jgi:DNA (cytosine-5)-methyltransferase 1
MNMDGSKNPSTQTGSMGKTTPTLDSFFAGIGGFDLGFERIGVLPTFHCELDPYCRAVLARHWPEVPCISDINDVKPNEIPDAEIWTGGFPC